MWNQIIDAIKEVHLAELKDQRSFQKVTISAKVLDIGDTNTLADGWRVLTILVGDDTDSALWKNFIDTCKLDKSYRFWR